MPASLQPPQAVQDPFDAAPDPMVVLGPDGAVLRANAAFSDTFRHPVSAKRPPWGRIAPPDFVDGMRRFDASAPDGRRFEWLERQVAGGARIAVARDVTDKAEAMAETARAKTLLFATLTHELRTPLNGILGLAGLLKLGALTPAQQDYVEAVRQSGEHLLDLITEILDYSRLEAGRIAFERADFDPEATAQSVVELLSPKARAKGLEIALASQAGVPAAVRGDDGRVRQILFNLAGNAVKFTEEGGVTLAVASAKSRPGDARQWLRFSVRDTGPGIPAEKQQLIFEEFSQADASHARRYGGAGLGLAIVKRLARAMGGDVGLESRLGSGAHFWADLPFDPAPSAQSGLGAAKVEALRVGLAIDHPVLHAAVRATLEGLGARVTPVRSASEGALCDAVLLDDACDERLGDGLVAAGATVIALIAQENRDAIARFRERGVAHYLMKPLRRRSVAERLAIAARGAPTRNTRLTSTEDDRAIAPRALGLTILLAEDNPINALLARTLLSRAGCRVEVVGNGEEAVAAAAKGGFDLVLLDLRMPLLDGLGAARRIRALPGKPGRVPLIALTADATEEDRTSAIAAGMDDFLTKPIDAGRLEAVLGRLSVASNEVTVRRR
jgi:signal transduction histidine kinase/CheY-like chemotaxis protein